MEIKAELFPCDITVEECYESIRDFPGFRVTEKFDHLIFNYDFAFRQSFPDPLTQETEKLKRLMAIRRECRGIIFHKETGKILARRLHKFFNINEMDECLPERIDLSQPHIILEKADGCLVTPFISEGVLRFGTKLGITEVTKTIELEYLVKHPECLYSDFSQQWIDQGYTPMFELCASKHQIILEYPEDIMYLIAIRLVCIESCHVITSCNIFCDNEHNINRDNRTGNYITWTELEQSASKYNIPIVKPNTKLVYQKEYSNATELLAKIKEMNDVEGYILLFENGLMYKAKTEWYMKRSKKANTTVFNEKDIWEMVLNGTIDDFAEVLGSKRLESIGTFGFELFASIKVTKEKIVDYVNRAREIDGITEKSDFVKKVEAENKLQNADPLLQFKKLFYCCFDGLDVESEIKKLILYNCSTSRKLEFIRGPICGGLKISLNS